MCAAGIVIRQGGDLVSTEHILTSGRAVNRSLIDTVF